MRLTRGGNGGNGRNGGNGGPQPAGPVHPPVAEKRIEQLAKIQAQLGEVSPGAKGLK